MGDTSNSDGLASLDRLSDLPDELKEMILSFLPLVDAIKTSKLSPILRHCWTRSRCEHYLPLVEIFSKVWEP